jgi:hypothetical protein
VRYQERRIRPTPARPFAALGNRAWRNGLSEQVLPAEQQPVELGVGGIVLGGRPLAAVRTVVVKPIAGWIAVTLEVVGIFIIAMVALNALFAPFIGVARALKQDGSERLFDQLRQRLECGILLGLELLVPQTCSYRCRRAELEDGRGLRDYRPNTDLTQHQIGC